MFVLNKLHKYLVDYYNDEHYNQFKYYFKINCLLFKHTIEYYSSMYEYNEIIHRYQIAYRCYGDGPCAFEIIKTFKDYKTIVIAINPSITDCESDVYFITLNVNNQKRIYEIQHQELANIIHRLYTQCEDKWKKYNWW
jgi:hypothetical protein